MVAKLKATLGVTAVTGSRIYPRLAPQSVSKPYIVVMRPSGEERRQQTTKRHNFVKTPLTVACVADTYEASRTLALAVTNAVDPRTSVTASSTWGSVTVDHCSVVQTFDHSGNPQLADEIGAPVEFVDVDLFYLEGI